MSIEENEKELIIRIPKRNRKKGIEEALAFLTKESFRGKSKASQKDIDTLVKQIKAERRPNTLAFLKKAGIEAK